MFVVALRRWAYNLSGFNKYGKSELNEVMLDGMVHCIGDFCTSCGRVLTVVCTYTRFPIFKYLKTQPNLQIQLSTVLIMQRERQNCFFECIKIQRCVGRWDSKLSELCLVFVSQHTFCL
jgi:hypothetical protein